MKKDIKLNTTIAELLNSYEGMKDILISINPKFKKLNNPILRRTLAKVATIRQAAFVGGMEPVELLNKIREAVGQEPLEIKDNSQKEQESLPNWVKGEPKVILDANELLDKEINPLAESKKILKTLNSGEFIAIKSDFRPEPLIDEFKKNGFKVAVSKDSLEEYTTYIMP